MILTLTPNPALDVTYTVEHVRPRDEHRVQQVRTAAGGKGVNVARVLAQLGIDAAVTGPLGGATGAHLQELLTHVDLIGQAWTPIDGETRRTLTVVDEVGATGFNEPGPRLSAPEIATLRTDLLGLLLHPDPPEAPVEAVTISGSLPPGMAPGDLSGLVRAAVTHDRPVLVDTSGPALLEAARAGATVLKPNAAEALRATGTSTPLAAAAALAELGPPVVVCSLGGDGMLGLEQSAHGRRAWRARLPEPLPGNPTGAGDAVVAVLATCLLRDRTSVPDALTRAVAIGAGAVARPVAGEVDLPLADRLRPTVEIEEIPCP